MYDIRKINKDEERNTRHASEEMREQKKLNKIKSMR